MIFLGIGIAYMAGQVAMNLAYWGMSGRRRK